MVAPHEPLIYPGRRSRMPSTPSVPCRLWPGDHVGRLQSLLSARSGPCGKAQRQPGPLPQRDVGFVGHHGIARLYRLHVPLHLHLLLGAALAGAAGQPARHAALRRAVGLLQPRADRCSSTSTTAVGASWAWPCLPGWRRAWCSTSCWPPFCIRITGPIAADIPRQLLIVAILSTVAAHFVEIHFGIAIAATRTYFWVLDSPAAGPGHALGNRRAVRQGALITAERSMARKPRIAAPAKRSKGRRGDSPNRPATQPAEQRPARLAGHWCRRRC